MERRMRSHLDKKPDNSQRVLRELSRNGCILNIVPLDASECEGFTRLEDSTGAARRASSWRRTMSVRHALGTRIPLIFFTPLGLGQSASGVIEIVRVVAGRMLEWELREAKP